MTEPQFTAQTVEELSKRWFEEWKPFLITDGEKLLGEVLTTVMASMAQLREGYQVQHDALNQAAGFARGARIRFEESIQTVQQLEATQLAQAKSFFERLERLERSQR